MFVAFQAARGLCFVGDVRQKVGRWIWDDFGWYSFFFSRLWGLGTVIFRPSGTWGATKQPETRDQLPDLSSTATRISAFQYSTGDGSGLTSRAREGGWEELLGRYATVGDCAGRWLKKHVQTKILLKGESCYSAFVVLP